PAAFGASTSTDDAMKVIRDLVDVLAEEDVLTAVDEDANGVKGYRLRASVVRWLLGDGTKGADDPLRRRLESEAITRVNPFFRDLYRDTAIRLAGLHAKEHTAQVPSDEREQREEAFREGDL